MKYRVQLDLAFKEKKDAIKLLNSVEELKKGAVKLENKLERYCNYHECSHDDPIPCPCLVTLKIDFDGDLITHKE